MYTNNIQKAKKLFETSLIKEGRLSYILSPKFDCLLYLSKDQQDKFKKIILPDTNFPEGLLNEAESDCVSEFERKMNKTSSVDLADLILGIRETNVEVKSDIKKLHEKIELKCFDETVKILEKWIEYYKKIQDITGVR